MKKLMFMLSAKDKTSEQVAKEGFEAFEKHQKVEKAMLDRLENNKSIETEKFSKWEYLRFVVGVIGAVLFFLAWFSVIIDLPGGFIKKLVAFLFVSYIAYWIFMSIYEDVVTTYRRISARKDSSDTIQNK